jgi:aminopeptidase N
LLQSPEDSTPQQLRANSLKSALFLADLHDIAGDPNFERALHRLQDAMVGRGVSLYIDDLRAALEDGLGRPIAGVFRQWLSNPGIPRDFRARYSEQSGTQATSMPAEAAAARSIVK